ncbi:MAG: YafY family transcriptional regulator [Clostridia bacterium]|nr:YafY family transcriptional regulator [Clostridia bacterium]
MKYEIMLGILFDLLSKRTITAPYLAEKYQVSIRTIYRYLESLEGAGVPLYTVRGNNGGIRIVDTYRLSSTFMSQKEYEHTLDALTSLNNNLNDKTLDSVINKLKSIIKPEQSKLSVCTNSLLIDAGPWGETTGYKNKLSVIQKSLDECKILSIKYHDRNGEISERTVEPHLIMFKQGLWYTYAYCHLRNEFRFFKTGRIEHATITNERFVRRKFNIEELPLNFWENAPKSTDIVLEINKSILSDVEEWLGIECIQNINGKFIAEASLPYDNGLISKIMSFGNNLKVVYPKELRNDVKKVANEIVNNYK